MWFEEVVKAHCWGTAYLCRYADDFVCAFQYEADARRFYKALGLRLAKFELSLAEDKTRIMRFSRLHNEDKTWFEFLGFEFRWGDEQSQKATGSESDFKEKVQEFVEKFFRMVQKE